MIMDVLLDVEFYVYRYKNKKVILPTHPSLLNSEVASSSSPCSPEKLQNTVVSIGTVATSK
jgi:hypothetical protein